MKQTLPYQNDTLENSHIQDSQINKKDSANILNEDYYEILISIHCKDPFLSTIITQAIADRILEYGEAVEFLEKDMIHIVDKEI